MKQQLLISLLTLLILGCKTQQSTVPTISEDVSIHFEQLKQKPEQLKAFFTAMPKGGDLHHHASGTPYAEQFIKYALKDSLWISKDNFTLYPNETAAKESGEQTVEINELLTNQVLKDSLIDHWSVRNYQQHGRDGHDWFFATFLKFGEAFVGREAELLSETCAKNSRDNVQYLETMIRVKNLQDSLALLTADHPWENLKSNTDEQRIAELYETMMASGLKELSQANADSLDAIWSRVDKHGIELKFQTYGLRIFDDHSLTFGQLVLGFHAASLTDNLLGVNFVAPEDNPSALKNYTLHMKMFDFLRKQYPDVHIALHAGELVEGKGAVTAEDLTFHIEEALTLAKAERIGHGVDLLSETNKEDILSLMKENGIAVEINLYSNEVILETSPDTHPLNTYLEAGVPVCISTDDEGVLRSNLIEQYLLLTKYRPNITYQEVKTIVYNGVRYSFLEKQDKQRLIKQLDEKFETFEQTIQR
ncbi:hypothetical protein [Algivirga pacifica]|uniref:adenosine deaminase n=1 Tax=Algivirga pacifica TaxID=1162670 RepID=A0ABP9DAW5_9BACT